MAGGAAVVVVAGVTVALVLGHSNGSNNAGDLVAARHVADSIVVPGLTPSSACTDGSSRCFADSQSVIVSSNAVFKAMQQQTHSGPHLRCFPHAVGDLPTRSQHNSGTLVDSCVVDVAVDGHNAYAYIDPVTSGSPTHPVVRGSTVRFAAN